METVRKLEETMAGWFKNAPHLPAGVQKWLADNVWWLALIAGILGAIAFFSVISATFLGGAILIGLGGPVGAAVAGVAFIAVLISLTSLGLLTLLTFMAVTPLKEHRKKGWELLFIAELASVILSALSILVGDATSIFGVLLSAAIGFYLLFEIHGHFGGKVKVEKTVEHKKVEEKKA